jgi:hypothetical protein
MLKQSIHHGRSFVRAIAPSPPRQRVFSTAFEGVKPDNVRIEVGSTGSVSLEYVTFINLHVTELMLLVSIILHGHLHCIR